MENDNLQDLRMQIYKVALYYTRNHHAAEDVVQNTFLRALLAIESIKDKSKTEQWFLVIAKRVAIDYLREQKRKKVYIQETYYEHVEQIILDRMLENEFNTQLMRFKPEVRSILILKIQHDLTEKMISEELNIPIGTVKSRMYYAKKKLKHFYEKELLRVNR